MIILVSPQELKEQDHVSIHHILCSIPSPNIKEDSIPPKGDTTNLQKPSMKLFSATQLLPSTKTAHERDNKRGNKDPYMNTLVWKSTLSQP
jgi:hypothetical protein